MSDRSNPGKQIALGKWIVFEYMKGRHEGDRLDRAYDFSCIRSLPPLVSRVVIGDFKMSFGRKTRQPKTTLAFARRKRGERYEETNRRANWRGTRGRKLPYRHEVRLQRSLHMAACKWVQA
ncbi:MAG: hypothetical protein M1813_000091 [Trichoglossum hirsutum]|nr:MAG: hypothetical protein M1813_000091 [Trichoglossum hirsutum]